jgi:hypothetical protein
VVAVVARVYVIRVHALLAIHLAPVEIPAAASAAVGILLVAVLVVLPAQAAAVAAAVKTTRAIYAVPVAVVVADAAM